MAVVKYLADISLEGGQLLNVRLQNLATAPGSPGVGRVYYDTNLEKVRVYDGTSWQDLVDHTVFDDHSARHQNGGDDEISVTGLSGELADPQTPKDHGNEAHTPNFAEETHNHDSDYVEVAGDTMTGLLTLSGDPTADLHAATKQYVDGAAGAGIGRYAETVVDPSTSETITHDLGTSDPIVQTYFDDEQVFVEVEVVNANTVELGLASSQTGSLRVVVVG